MGRRLITHPEEKCVRRLFSQVDIGKGRLDHEKAGGRWRQRSRQLPSGRQWHAGEGKGHVGAHSTFVVSIPQPLISRLFFAALSSPPCSQVWSHAVCNGCHAGTTQSRRAQGG